MSASSRTRFRRRLVLPLAALLVGSTLSAVPAAATPWQETAPQDVKGVRVTDAKAGPGRAPWTAQARARRGPAKVTWPAAGSATIELAAAGLSAAAGTPVHVGRAVGGTSRRPGVGRVRVDVADRAATARAGVSGVLFAVGSADGVAGPVAVDLDYSGFAEAGGGDYGSRLRLVRLPACALTTPQRAECQRATPVTTRNDVAKRRLTADVAVAASGMTVLAAEAGAAGDNGDFTATSLAPAGSWQVSAQTGAFSWSYPLRMPPALGGPSPSVGLAYSSGSIDGRTSTTNNQGSWLGDGWEFWPGYIERSYNSCNDDNPSHKTGDLCWLSDNATLSLNGHSGELINAGGTWRLKTDDGTRIEKVTGDASRGNGAAGNEYWKVTTTDGVQYFFGYHRLPNWQAGNPVTDATWTVPVFGDDAGEPCPQAYCIQAWRWNLDYVVDPHGNTQALFYGKETGAYGQNQTAGQRVTYDRGGWLDRIEYGMRAGSEYAQAAPLRVTFKVEERCLSGCWSGLAWQSDPAPSAWKDSPWDQYCAAAPCNDFAPTFWSARRLTKITTQVRNGTTTYADVESWALRQEFLDAGTSEGTPMWLRGIAHTGHVTTAGGTAQTDPEITFDPSTVPLPNRVDGPAVNRTSLNRWRIKMITTESGGQIQITYSPTTDCSRVAPPNPEFNTSRCMPVLADGAGTPTLDWFHKYVVTRVESDDVVTDQPTEVTDYDYPANGGAWHFATDEVTKDNLRTWSEWRGYGQVQVRHGALGDRQTATEHRYLRGMDGDKSPSSPGGVRDVQVTDPWGGTVEDHEALQGFTLGQLTYNGPGGAEVTSTVHRPWKHGPHAARTRGGVTVEAWTVATGESRSRTALASGGHRYTKTATAYNSDGFPIAVDNFGDENVPGDETCTRMSYARNDTSWMIDKVSQAERLSVECADATTPAAAATVLSRTRTFYDTYVSEASLGAAPSEGDVVRIEELDRWNGSTPVYLPTSQNTYDDNGRVTQVIDARGNPTTTSRVTAHGGLVVRTTVTNARGHSAVSDVEPAWGLPTKVSGANNTTGGTNDVTTTTYDGLGRMTQIWRPGRATSLSPSARFTYQLRSAAGQPSAVTTETLLPSGAAYRKAVTLYDGWLRVRQTQLQAAGGGRLLTDTRYDTAGAVVASTNPYYDKSDTAVNTTVGVPVGTVPGVTQRILDGAGRETAAIFLADGVEAWRTTTDDDGDRVHVTPPQGGTATTSIIDAFGRPSELRQYKDHAYVGSTDPTRYLATTYTYQATGSLATVVDPNGNKWTFEYDLRGRQTSYHDPDKGLTTRTFDAGGNLESTRDAKNKVLWFEYDELNRKIAMRDDSQTGSIRASWIYDTLPYGKGRLTSSTRWVGSTAYTSRVNSYDQYGRVSSTSVVLPSSAGALCAAGGLTPCVYTTTSTYKANGAPYQTTMPAAGDLPSEKLTLGYTDVGDPNTLISPLASYVHTATYNRLSQLVQRELGTATSKIAITTTIDDATRRLESVLVEATGKPDAAYYTYAYDDAGNLDRITDAAVGQPADNQCFRRDHLRRLVDVWTPASGNCGTGPSVAGLQTGSAAYWHAYSYDDIGNRATHTVNAAAGPTTYTYTVPPSGPTSVRPHAVTSVRMDAPGGATWTRGYTYDVLGNTETRHSEAGASQTLDWDREQLLTSVIEGTKSTSYLYDAEGGRLIRTDGDGARTLSLPGMEVRVAAGATSATATRYYSHAGSSIGMRTSAGVTWLVSDHHGTAELAIKASDLSVSKRRTTPFGKERGAVSGTWPTGTDTGFVGGVKDGTGLTHLGAREYDPLLGRFVSVDPLLDTNDPQSMNNYAYSGNNPVDYTDPAGTRRCPPDELKDGCTEDPKSYARSAGPTKVTCRIKDCTPDDTYDQRHQRCKRLYCLYLGNELKDTRLSDQNIEYAGLAVKWGNELGVDPKTLLAIILRESNDWQSWMPIQLFQGSDRNYQQIDSDGASLGITNVKRDLMEFVANDPTYGARYREDLDGKSHFTMIFEDDLAVETTALAIRIELDKLASGKFHVAQNARQAGVTDLEAASAVHQVKNGGAIIAEGSDPGNVPDNVLQHIHNQNNMYLKDADFILCKSGIWSC